MRSRDLEIIVPDPDQQRLPNRKGDQTDAAYLITDDGEPSSGESSSELQPEFQTAPSIFAYGTDAGFRDGVAWGQAYMSYFASHAKQVLTLSLRFNNSQIANTPAVSERGDWLPAYRSLWTDARLFVAKSCGHALDASTSHSAWHEWQVLFKGLLKWGLATTPSGDLASQSACPPESDGGGGGGGGGGSGVYVCYCLDYYSPTTGQWEHGGIIYCLEA
ncbi:MAG: hypothetical protein M3282_13320 [Gemmatimonadota bacterium]|nr:hypothetical protein [Gemmatimonadota bacterium]